MLITNLCVRKNPSLIPAIYPKLVSCETRRPQHPITHIRICGGHGCLFRTQRNLRPAGPATCATQGLFRKKLRRATALSLSLFHRRPTRKGTLSIQMRGCAAWGWWAATSRGGQLQPSAGRAAAAANLRSPRPPLRIPQRI